MNPEPAASTPAGALHLQRLLQRWISLAEAALAQIEDSRPESTAAMETLMNEQVRLLEQWHDLERRPTAGPPPSPGEEQARTSMVTLRLAAQQAMALNRRIELAVRSRERFLASRLEALLGAAGMPGIYSSAGSVQRAMTSGAAVIAT